MTSSILQKPIGLMGGTFDPIHFGHLRTAIELYQQLNLAEVKFIPCYQPVHRQLPVATPEDRLAMVSHAIKDEPAFSVNECEIQRKGPSYSIDTIQLLKKNLPSTPLCLIMGIDAFTGFHTWHRWEEILTHVHLIIAHRPHYQLPTTGIIAELLAQRFKTDASALSDSLAGNIVVRPVTLLEISATDIRQQIHQEQSCRYLLPDSVYTYIKQHRVYR